MVIKMPEDAKRIIDKLIENGYEAYIVGGCVRDVILGKTPDDWDITTNATPEITKSLFRRTIDTGIEHGTVTIMCGKEGYEVTTYRVDGKYEDHRRPSEVTFTVNLEEDLKRRDFTINAMAYNEVEGLIDIYGGMKDLEAGIIRCVGNPEDRFDEDALRILRAVRFSAQLGFDIEENTKRAIVAKAEFLKDISAERIQVELTKLLVSRHPEKLIDAYDMGITDIILPEFNAMMETPQNNMYHMYDVGRHSIEVVKAIEAKPVLRWAALLHDVAKPATRTTGEDGIDHFYGHNVEGIDMAATVLRRMKLDNKTIDRVKRLVEWHDFALSEIPTKKSFRRSLSKMGTDLFDDYVKIKRADIAGQSDFGREKKLEIIAGIEKLYEEIVEEENCLTVKDLAIDGKNLIELGIKPGPHMKTIFNKLLDMVLDEPKLNEYDILKTQALAIWEQLDR